MKQQQRASESLGASEPTSWDGEGATGTKDAMFDGCFADGDEEEAFIVAGAPLNESLATERSARRTVAQARAIMHDIKSSRGGYCSEGSNKKGVDAEKGKGKSKSRDNGGH